MNWRTIFLLTTLVFIFFTSNTAVAEGDGATSDKECIDLWNECLQAAANQTKAIKALIKIVHKAMMKACDNIYDKCMKSKIRLPRPWPIPVPGEKWLICQAGRRTCQGLAHAFKFTANMAAGNRMDLCNDAKDECMKSV